MGMVLNHFIDRYQGSRGGAFLVDRFAYNAEFFPDLTYSVTNKGNRKVPWGIRGGIPEAAIFPDTDWPSYSELLGDAWERESANR